MSRKTADKSGLLERIDYRFTDETLLDRSLTHISALSGKSRSGSYQRLEFLGDRVLGLVISDMLLRAFPKADEGENFPSASLTLCARKPVRRSRVSWTLALRSGLAILRS